MSWSLPLRFGYDPLEYYFHFHDLGDMIIEQPGHWVAVISEPTIHNPSVRDPPSPDRHEYILLNEMLACITLIFRQINDPVWAPTLTPKLESWNFTGEGRSVKVSRPHPMNSNISLLAITDHTSYE